MASIPTRSNLETSLVDIADQVKLNIAHGVALAAKADAVGAASNWPGGGALSDAARAERFDFARFMRTPMAEQYARIMGGYLSLAESPETNLQRGWEDIWDDFIDNYRTVESRAITFDTGFTTAGTGNPTWRRLTVDESGYDIESVWADDINIECTASRTLGVELGQEAFRISMPRALDIFSLDISGENKATIEPSTFNLINDDVENLQDLSFENDTGAADSDPDDCGAWIDAAGTYGTAKYAYIEDGYRLSVRESALNSGAGTKLCLQIKGDSELYQIISNIDENNPYDWGVWAKKTASQTGTLTMSVGSNSTATVDVSTLSTSSWTFVVPTLDKNLWPRNFDDSARKIKIVTTSSGGGTGIYVDNVKFEKFKQFNGTWWIGTPGSTAVQRDYTATVTDSISSDSVIQRHVFLAFGQRNTTRGVGYYLPARAPATQVTASGGRTLTFANSGSTITASSGDFTSDGYYAGMKLTVAGTSSNNGDFTIISVSATVLTVSESITNEGPLSSTATLDAQGYIADP